MRKPSLAIRCLSTAAAMLSVAGCFLTTQVHPMSATFDGTIFCSLIITAAAIGMWVIYAKALIKAEVEKAITRLGPPVRSLA